MPGAQPVGGQACHAGKQQNHDPQMRQVQLAQPFHGNGDEHHRCTEQHEAQAVEPGPLAAPQVRNESPHRITTRHAHRQVDQENPVPAQILHQPTAHGRPQQGAEQPGNGDEAHDANQLRARVGAQHHQSPHRQHQCPAQALDHPRADQHAQAVGQGAQQRAEAEQQDGAEENALGAEAVGNPAGSRDQDGHGEHVGDDHRLHAQRVFGQVPGHGRQGGVEDGAVERLHEKGNRHDPGDPARGGGVEG
ncbi:hypothetical protein D3C86_1354970 [compost metagenome]